MKNGKIKEKLINKKSVKGFFAIIIAAVLLFSVVPAITFATNTDTDTTNDDNQISATKAKAASVKVTFNANKGKFGTKKTTVIPVKKGKKIGKLPTKPKRNGFVFSGWYTKKDGEKKISKNTKVTQKVTFYAQWDPVIPGGLMTSKYQEYVYLSYQNGKLSQESITKSGYTGKNSASIYHKKSYYNYNSNSNKYEYTKKPVVSKTRWIIKDGYDYEINDVTKSYYKYKIEKPKNNNKNDYLDVDKGTYYFPKVVRSTGTATFAPKTKYAKKLKYIQFTYTYKDKSVSKYRYYMNGKKVYGTETNYKYSGIKYKQYSLYTKVLKTAPSKIFALNIKGYKDNSYYYYNNNYTYDDYDDYY